MSSIRGARDPVSDVRQRAANPYLYKSSFDPSVNVRLRHSFNGGHYRRGGLGCCQGREPKGRPEGRPSQATGYGSRRRSRCCASLTTSIPRQTRRQEMNGKLCFHPAVPEISSPVFYTLPLLPKKPALFAVPVPRLFGLALVVQLFSAGERDFDFRPTLLVEIDF